MEKKKKTAKYIFYSLNNSDEKIYIIYVRSQVFFLYFFPQFLILLFVETFVNVSTRSTIDLK